jgi:hypothetical protein
MNDGRDCRFYEIDRDNPWGFDKKRFAKMKQEGSFRLCCFSEP